MRTSGAKKCFLILFMSVLCFGIGCQEAAAAKKPAKVVIKSIGNDEEGNITVFWKKVSGASKYQVQTAENEKFTQGKQNKTVSAKKRSAVISNLKIGKSYYIRVRAYRTVKGKKRCGKWSDSEYVNVKGKVYKPDDGTDTDGDKTSKKDLSKIGMEIYFSYGRTEYSHAYTGKAIAPKIEVHNDSLYLTEDTDYKVSYSNNTDAGEAEITVKGMGKYKGSLTKKFTITKVNQRITATLENPVIYVGKTGKVNVAEAYGTLEFIMSSEGIAAVSPDGTITALRAGTTRINVKAGGDSNHNAVSSYYVGTLTVMQEEATAYGFSISSWNSKSTYKKMAANSRNADGTNTYSVNFYCNAAESWLDNNVTFEAEDVTPAAYAQMFTDMGTAYAAPVVTLASAQEDIAQIQKYGYDITITEPFTEAGPSQSNETAASGKRITIEAGAGVRAVKLTAKKNGIVLDSLYLGTSGKDKDGNSSAYDLDLYKQVRKRVEAKIWTNDMSNLDKIEAMAGYINGTAHYPGTATTTKEYNPAFWNRWSVDDRDLFYNMFNDVILNRIMDLQGGIVTCLAAELLATVAEEDLGLPYLYDSDTDEIAAGEGIWLVSGSYSSNPTNPYHYSLKYKYADERTCLIDAQGLMYGETSQYVSCESHGCMSKIVSLR